MGLQLVQDLPLGPRIERSVADKIDSRQILLTAGRMDQLGIGERLHGRDGNQMIGRDAARRQRAAQFVTETVVADGAEYGDSAHTHGSQIVGDGAACAGAACSRDDAHARDSCFPGGFSFIRIVRTPAIEADVPYDERGQFRQTVQDFRSSHNGPLPYG